MLNRRLNTVSRCEIGTLVHKDRNRQLALKMYAADLLMLAVCSTLPSVRVGWCQCQEMSGGSTLHTSLQPAQRREPGL